MCHFKSAADKAKALSDLTTKQRKQASTPHGLALLVRDKVVDERYINRLLIKGGGMSRAVQPREVSNRKVVPCKLGNKGFLAKDDAAVVVHGLIGLNPKGFRQPSNKAKNWRSTSLMEQVTGVKPTFTRSKRGDKEALAEAEHRELVKATHDVRNVADKYLSPGNRRLKASLPPLAKVFTLDAIRYRHALARGDEPTGPIGATGHKAAA